MNNASALCQTILSLQNNLIKIEVAISNKTMHTETARKHIKQILLLTDEIEKQYNCSELTCEIKNIAKDIVEKTKIQYKPNSYVR